VITMERLVTSPSAWHLVTADAPNELAGTYFYKNNLKDFPLKGSIHRREVVLEQFEDNGHLRGTFRLSMPERDPKGRLAGTLDGEVLVGEWRDSRGDKPTAVYLKLQDILTGYKKLTDRYASTGAAADAELESNVQAFYSAVLRGDKVTASGLVRYPLAVRNSHKPGTIRTKAQFIGNYELIFTREYLECIRSRTPHNMFVHNGEVMLGKGEVWFDGQGFAVTLSPCED
jgi:hypothetical protein